MSPAGRRGPFSWLWRGNFRGFNKHTAIIRCLCHKLSKPNTPYVRYLRPRGCVVDFAATLSVNMCELRDCTLGISYGRPWLLWAATYSHLTHLKLFSVSTFHKQYTATGLILEKVWPRADCIIEKVWPRAKCIIEKVWPRAKCIIEKVHLRAKGRSTGCGTAFCVVISLVFTFVCLCLRTCR